MQVEMMYVKQFEGGVGHTCKNFGGPPAKYLGGGELRNYRLVNRCPDKMVSGGLCALDLCLPTHPSLQNRVRVAFPLLVAFSRQY